MKDWVHWSWVWTIVVASIIAGLISYWLERRLEAK